MEHEQQNEGKVEHNSGSITNAISNTSSGLEFQCYYCDSFKTNSSNDYERHTINKHGLGHPCYPSMRDIEKLGLKPQGRSWEV